MLFPSLSVSDHLATMLRRSAGQYDHGTPIPVDLNVSGHRQHGVFSTKTGPCKPTVIQPKAGVELPPFQKKQNALTASAFAWLKLPSFRPAQVPGHQQRLRNSPRNERERLKGAVPRRSGTAIVRRGTRSSLTAAS